MLYFFLISSSHIIIQHTPKIIPIDTVIKLDISNASGIKSKHITAIISPEANDNMKLNNLLDVLFIIHPIIPPSVVPNVPKNNHSKVVLNISI